jgi:hypothetical protein
LLNVPTVIVEAFVPVVLVTVTDWLAAVVVAESAAELYPSGSTRQYK